MTSLNQLSATEIAQGIAAKKFTAEAVVRDCLARIEAREPVVQAWATIDPDYALAPGARARPRSEPRRAARRADRRQGHHRHRRPADRDGLGNLQGQSLVLRCRLRRDRARGGRGDPRQDRDRRIRRHVARADHQSAQSGAYAGRLVERIGRRRRRSHGAGGVRHADRRLGAAARRLLRRGRLQADLQSDQPRRHQVRGRDARHHRAPRQHRSTTSS